MHIGAKPIENLLMIMVLKKNTLQEHPKRHLSTNFVGLAYQDKDIVFKFIIDYSSLRDFGP
jgi:hypothetical protein